jgi:hypothetical protein
VGARTDAARAEVVARRQLLAQEVVRLEAAGRSALDVPGRLRRSPARVGLAAAGVAFVALRGPQRLYRGFRRLLLGPRANLPKSMLPKEIDKALRSLGDDGGRVRGVLEREFADYLAEHGEERRARDLRATLTELGGNLLRPVSAQAGKRLARQLFSTDREGFGAAMDRIRSRRDRATAEAASAAPSASPRPESRWERRRRG